jgi:hypothetical protein
MYKMKKTKEKHPTSRKQSEKESGTSKKEREKAASAQNEQKQTKTGRTQGHNPMTDNTKSNKMKAGKPYKQQ